jgi:hypothetical protein
MIRLTWLRDQSILLLIPEGPLEKADFEKLNNEIDPLITAKGKLTGLMIYTNSFPGWESFGAMVSHLKFVSGHHRHIERIAVVTDSYLLKIVPLIALFVNAEVRHFPSKEKDSALTWLETGRL